ncbi:MAG TPA: hypothetical protein VGD39_12310 [Nocardioides sp.]
MPPPNTVFQPETPSDQRFPLGKHTVQDIPIHDGEGNRIGVARVDELSLKLGRNAQQRIEMSLDVELDNPLQVVVDPFRLDGLHISLGDEPDPAEACQQRPSQDAGARAFVPSVSIPVAQELLKPEPEQVIDR